MLHVTFIGNLGGDAETRDAADTTVTNFSVATKSGIKKDDPPIWVRCALWGNRGTALEQYLSKGTRVLVTGVLALREYEADGETRYSVDCRVDQLELHGSPQGAERGAERAAPPPRESTKNGGRSGGRSAGTKSERRADR